MNPIRFLIKLMLLIISITVVNVCFAQDPFKLLDKAESLISKGHFEGALSKLDRAENSHYCNCGSCSGAVERRANLLRYEAFLRMNQFDKALSSLDSIYFSSYVIDSLKVQAYKMKLGASFLSQHIDEAISRSSIECFDYECYVNIPIQYEVEVLRFKLYLSENTRSLFGDISDDEKVMMWIEIFKGSDLYKLIKEES